MQQAGISVDDLTISIGLPSEEDTLVAELQSGSERAFAQLIDRYHQPLYSLIAHSLQDPADAADITQEVFLKVFRSIRGFHSQSSLRTWLYRIALREASNQRRWWSRHKYQEIALDAPCCGYASSDSAEEAQPLISTLACGGASPFDQAAQQEVRECVEAALRQLPKSYRAVVVLREIEGFSYDEIADLLQVNLGTVKSRLMRGRAALRALLAQSSGILSNSRASEDCRAAVAPPPRAHALPTSLPGPTLNTRLEVSG
jgi:RNA polymerase sigma-70 factor, ECF subfamily